MKCECEIIKIYEYANVEQLEKAKNPPEFYKLINFFT